MVYLARTMAMCGYRILLCTLTIPNHGTVDVPLPLPLPLIWSHVRLAYPCQMHDSLLPGEDSFVAPSLWSAAVSWECRPLLPLLFLICMGEGLPTLRAIKAWHRVPPQNEITFQYETHCPLRKTHCRVWYCETHAKSKRVGNPEESLGADLCQSSFLSHTHIITLHYI